MWIVWRYTLERVSEMNINVFADITPGLAQLVERLTVVVRVYISVYVVKKSIGHLFESGNSD